MQAGRVPSIAADVGQSCAPLKVGSAAVMTGFGLGRAAMPRLTRTWSSGWRQHCLCIHEFWRKIQDTGHSVELIAFAPALDPEARIRRAVRPGLLPMTPAPSDVLPCDSSLASMVARPVGGSSLTLICASLCALTVAPGRALFVVPGECVIPLVSLLTVVG